MRFIQPTTLPALLHSACFLLALQVPALLAHEPHPLGQEVLDWAPDPGILRTLTNAYNLHAGATAVSWRPNGRVVQAHGRQCISGPQFLFDVDDNLAFDIDETIGIEMLVDASVSSGLTLAYDHAVNPVAMAVPFPVDGTSGLTRITVDLPRARFANRLYGHTDFSIAAPNATIFPASTTAEHQLLVCDLRLRREHRPRPAQKAGTLVLSITDEHGEPVTVRAGLYDADGRMPLVGDDALALDRYGERLRQLPLRETLGYWPGKGRFVFYIDGRYRASVPPGEYQLVLSRGPEYRLLTRSIRVEEGQTTNLALALQRWIDMPARGWYSADDHIHIERPDQSVNAGISAFVRSEDIHLANLLEMTNIASSHYRQYAFGPRGHYLAGDYALVPGQESPRTSHLGHTIGLNAGALHLDRAHYYLYENIARAVRADGGMWGYAHAAIDAFHLSRGLALDVPMGLVDFMEVLQLNTLNPALLYDFLNMGFEVLPSAGSDFPYMHVPGAERIYARLDGPFTVQNWFDAWRKQRSFVSNGPIISFALNDDTRSRRFDVAAGERINMVAEVAVNPDLDRIDRLELVRHGEVIATATASAGAESLRLTHSYAAGESHWLALRAFGHGMGKAHTAPVFVYVDGERDFRDRRAAPALARRYLALLDEIAGSMPDLDTEWEHFDVGAVMVPRWLENLPALEGRIARARERYRQLLTD